MSGLLPQAVGPSGSSRVDGTVDQHTFDSPLGAGVDLPTYVQQHSLALSFPRKLMLLLEHVEHETARRTVGGSDDEAPIEWLSNGRAFAIRDKERLVREWLPLFFTRGAKFSSFTRKLYRWGFRQPSSSSRHHSSGVPPSRSDDGMGSTPIVFGHRYFRRDEPELISMMKSVTAESSRRRLDASARRKQQKQHLSPLGDYCFNTFVPRTPETLMQSLMGHSCISLPAFCEYPSQATVLQCSSRLPQFPSLKTSYLGSGGQSNDSSMNRSTQQLEESLVWAKACPESLSTVINLTRSTSRTQGNCIVPTCSFDAADEASVIPSPCELSKFPGCRDADEGTVGDGGTTTSDHRKVQAKLERQLGAQLVFSGFRCSLGNSASSWRGLMRTAPETHGTEQVSHVQNDTAATVSSEPTHPDQPRQTRPQRETPAVESLHLGTEAAFASANDEFLAEINAIYMLLKMRTRV